LNVFIITLLFALSLRLYSRFRFFSSSPFARSSSSFFSWLNFFRTLSPSFQERLMKYDKSGAAKGKQH